MVRARRAFLVGLVLTAWLAPVVGASRDLASELVGTWEGTQQQLAADRGGETASRERTLVVRSVERRGDGWRVDASFGVSGQKLTRFQGAAAALAESGGEATLTLTYKSGNTVRLSLARKDWLQGVHRSTGRGTERTLSLSRVSTTPAKAD